MISVANVTKSFGPRTLLRGTSLQVGARDRVALVGPNGIGKTTLLEMIAGAQEPDSGEIVVPKGVVVGYLRQETDALRGRSLLDEVLSAGAEVTEAGHRLSVLEDEMADLPEGPERDALIAEYGRLQDRFTTLGGYTLESEAKRILGGLGFKDTDHDRPTDALSGGWLMRVALAKLLLSNPDVLMLDEPTNHLDLSSVDWLEHFLTTYEGAVILISHDRDFMNAFATKVVEIDNGKLVSYTGDYEAFVRQRAIAAEQAAATAKNQARQRAETERFIERFRYKASKARQVQSRIKALERMQTVDVRRSSKRKMGLAFPTPPRSGRVVLTLDKVSFGYGKEDVYKELDIVIERDQKVALVGPNGAGKTTLLKLLAGVLEPRGGERIMGHNAALGYFAQHQIEALEPRNTVLQELAKAMPPGSDLRPRDLLGRFLFSGDEVDKNVSVLSGGERTRLALAKMLVSPANILCMDEPTNHLDISSRDILEDALEEYEGALVLITHDRHLIRSVANAIVEVIDGRVRWFEGDYDDYLARKETEEASVAPQQTEEKSGPKGKERRRLEAEARSRTKELRDKTRKLEADIERLSSELGQISEILADPEVYAKGVDIAELVKDYERIKRRVGVLEKRWEESAAALEEASG
jgi:ATP-binding cassette subfamily F protein 3